MPYVKISASEKGNNKGSCSKLVNYLDKENLGKELKDREVFFSHTRDYENSRQVIEHIDGNKGQLGKKDAKFFMLTINPSEKELAHIGNDKQKLKEYTREVMNVYAENFGKGLTGKDLVYYAKIEENRYYKGTDPAVREGKIKQGEVKAGNNMHVHVIVSRKDMENKIKLSPMTSHRNTDKGTVKGGFDREAFQEKAEKAFDQKFGYERKLHETFQVNNALRNGTREEKEAARSTIRESLALSAAERSIPFGKEQREEKFIDRGEEALKKDTADVSVLSEVEHLAEESEGQEQVEQEVPVLKKKKKKSRGM